jgi:type VI secretion system secreted protein VgrG
MLLTTDARRNASGTQLDSREAQAQIEHSHQLQTALAGTAQKHNAAAQDVPVSREAGRPGATKLPGEPAAEKLPAIAQMQHSMEVVNSTADHGTGHPVTAYSEPHLQLSSPAGIAASTPVHAILTAGHTSSLTAQDINLTAQGGSYHLAKDGISLFTYGDAHGRASAAGGRMPGAAKASNKNTPHPETGIKLHAASGKVSAQAQSGALKITADKTVTVASITQGITLAAKQHVLLTAGGAYIKLAGDNIEIHGPGAMAFKAGLRERTGPVSASVAGVSLPNGDLELPQVEPALRSLQWQLHSGLDGQLQGNVPYQIVSDGQVVAQGRTDASGQTQRHTEENFHQPVEVWFGESGWSVLADPGDEATPVPLDDQLYDNDDDLQEA